MIYNGLKDRRSYYSLDKNLPVKEEELKEMISQVTELVPDAFNMKSARAVVVLGENQELLWDNIYNEFGGKVPREKIDGFRAAAGTILYFYDENTVKAL